MINRINSNTSYLLKINNNLKRETGITEDNLKTRTDKKRLENKITIENLLTDSTNSENVFREYKISSQRSTGRNFHLYDISNLADEFDFQLENSKILSYTNECGHQEFRCMMKYPNSGKVVSVEIGLPSYSSDSPMNEETFKNNIVKAFKAMSKTLSTKNKLGDVQLDSFGTNEAYDGATKSLDMKKLKESLLSCIDRRTKYAFTESYNGNMNLMVDKMELEKSIKALEEFLDKILEKN